MLNIIRVHFIGWDTFWVLFSFLAVVAEGLHLEEDDRTCILMNLQDASNLPVSIRLTG